MRDVLTNSPSTCLFLKYTRFLNQIYKTRMIEMKIFLSIFMRNHRCLRFRRGFILGKKSINSEGKCAIARTVKKLVFN